MRKMKKEILVVALLLPLFIFLLSSSVSDAQQINARVTVNPKPFVYCSPTTLTAGSSVQWIYCFTELIGADVHDVNPYDVSLTMVGKLGLVPADPFFKQFGDFDSDGRTEIMLRFSRASADISWFNSLTGTTQLTFDMFGSVRGFTYDGTSPLLFIKAGRSSARYFQLNAPDIGSAKIDWLYGPSWFNYTKYVPNFLHFSGYFYNFGTRFSGTSSFYSGGYVNVEKTYHYLFFDRTVTEKQPVTISVYMNSYSDCFFNQTTSFVHCEGPALLSIKKTGTGETYSTQLPFFRFDITNYKASMEGGNIFNELVKVSDITMTHIYAI
jgi:hypothetical protein